jgi:hypothetical protein
MYWGRTVAYPMHIKMEKRKRKKRDSLLSHNSLYAHHVLHATLKSSRHPFFPKSSHTHRLHFCNLHTPTFIIFCMSFARERILKRDKERD